MTTKQACHLSFYLFFFESKKAVPREKIYILAYF